MSGSNDPVIDVSRSGAKTSKYQIRNAVIIIDYVDGSRRWQRIFADLVVDHDRLRCLIEKAVHNKSQRSGDGPLTVRVIKCVPVNEGQA